MARTSSPLDVSQDTIIVGAGIAGLACARRLHDAGGPFLMISENLGGRIRRSRDEVVNLGAYYVRADYIHVNQFVRLGRRLDRMAVRRHDGANAHTYWDRRLLLNLPQAARFLRLLLRFRRHYEDLKERSLTMGQAAAIRSDSLLFRLHHQPAQEFIDEHRLGEFARCYLAPGLHGTTFTSLDGISAFMLLLGSLPVLVPAYEFTFQLDRLTDGFAASIAADTVTGISQQGDGYQVVTRNHGTLMAARVVIATPPDAGRRLLGLPAVERTVAAHMFQVAGALRDPYCKAELHLFAETDPTLAIAQQAGGSVLFCSQHRHPDFDRYFTSWRVVDYQHWDPAFHLPGDELLECEQGKNLYLIGDHNIVGLEDAYLTGLYAANQIIASNTDPGPETPRRPSSATSRLAAAGTVHPRWSVQ